MRAKALEIRDTATFIPVIAVELVPDEPATAFAGDLLARCGLCEAQRWLLARCGLGMPGSYRVAVFKLQSGMSQMDPNHWGGRTMTVAHEWIAEHWDRLKDGDVVDVRYILGDADAPAVSERFTAP